MTDYVAFEEPRSSASAGASACRGTLAALVLACVAVLFFIMAFVGLPADAFSMRLTSAVEQVPPLLCYEYTARVRRHVTLVEATAEATVEATTYLTKVSRAADIVGILSEDAQYEKQFLAFSTVDDEPGDCVDLEVTTFFDENICNAFSAAKPRHRSDGCSQRELAKQTPLDGSFRRPSEAYTGAQLMASARRVSDGALRLFQRWRFVSDVEHVNLTDVGVRYEAAVQV